MDPALPLSEPSGQSQLGRHERRGPTSVMLHARMGERESVARALREDSAIPNGPTPPALRPVLDPEPWTPPQLTTGFAVGWALTLGVLGTITAVWLVGMVTVVVLLILGQGGVGTALAFAGTGVLLGRGWVGMAQTIRSRLRRRDLDDPAALPGTFAALSSPLQRLVRHTRSLAIVVRDPELPLAELDREMFEWISIVAKLPPEDRRMLEERGMGPVQLREDLVHSRWQEDKARNSMAFHRRWLARRDGRGHRERAVAVLERLEHEVLRPTGDPFRGSGPRRRSS